jgi:ADP-ribose pyrophosphatase YjhB (NUDIX family)
MVMPDMGSMPVYEPKWLGVREINLGDLWRAKWVDTDELPANAPVKLVYGVVFAADKGYVTRRKGESVWNVLEAEVAKGEKPLDCAKRAAFEQFGAKAQRVVMVGYLECKATSHNPDEEAGTVSVRPVYSVAASKVEDVPDESGYERRRMPMNEHGRALRARYPEFAEYLAQATESYVLARVKGEAP